MITTEAHSVSRVEKGAPIMPNFLINIAFDTMQTIADRKVPIKVTARTLLFITHKYCAVPWKRNTLTKTCVLRMSADD